MIPSKPLFYLLFFSVVILGGYTFFHIQELNHILEVHSESSFNQDVWLNDKIDKQNAQYEEDIKQIDRNFDTLNLNDEYYGQVIKNYHPDADINLEYECPMNCEMGCVFEDDVPYCLDVVIKGEEDDF